MTYVALDSPQAKVDRVNLRAHEGSHTVPAAFLLTVSGLRRTIQLDGIQMVARW
jgi:predicted ABC-type ATPase